MKKLNPNQVGMALGGLVGIWHLFWAALVYLNLAKSLLDFILGLHFLNNPYRVSPFEIGNAVMLIVVTAVVGYVMGFVFTLVWNRVRK